MKLGSMLRLPLAVACLMSLGACAYDRLPRRNDRLFQVVRPDYEMRQVAVCYSHLYTGFPVPTFITFDHVGSWPEGGLNNLREWTVTADDPRIHGAQRASGQPSPVEYNLVIANGSTAAASINGAGIAVGAAREEAGQGYAIVHAGAEVVAHLNPLPGTAYARATDINDDGVAVGASFPSNPNEIIRPTVWRMPDWIPESLPGFQIQGNSYLTAINNRGQMVGRGKPPGSETGRPFLWSPDEEPHTLYIGPSWGHPQPNDVNDSGAVVGEFDNFGDGPRGWIWSPGSEPDNFQILLPRASASDARARSINNAWRICGSSGGHACLWNPRWENAVARYPSLVDLNTVVRPISGAPGLVLTDAVRINDSGMILCVGVRLPQQPDYRQFYLLTPRLPALAVHP